MSRPDIIRECAAAMQESKAWPAVYGVGTAELLTAAALKVLRERMFINEWGLDAIKEAEAARK